MKKQVLTMIAVLSMTIGITGCGDTKQQKETQETRNPVQTDADGGIQKTQEGSSYENNGAIRVISSGNSYCATENGYYYVTGDDGDSAVLKDGTPCHHIMYMDYATKQEVYLCSNAGCNHDTEDCTAVIAEEADNLFFPFLFDGMLYILSAPYDSGGSYSSVWVNPEYEDALLSVDDEEGQGILYRMKPDGTQREKFYTFEEELKIGSMIFADDAGLYLQTSKVEMEQTGENNTYYATADRKIMRLDIGTKELKEIYSFDDQGAKWGTWDLYGTNGSQLILIRTVYPSDFTEEDMFPEEKEEMDVWLEKYEKSTDEYAFLDLSAKEITTKYQLSNQEGYYHTIKDGCLYLTFEEDNRLVKVDLESGEETTLLEDDRLKGSVIWNVYTDYLTVARDEGLYLIDYKSGEMSQKPLVDSLNWILNIRAENSDSFLVIYDYDAVPDEWNDGGYDISQYKYALIKKKDLFEGKNNYEAIAMIGKGK